MKVTNLKEMEENFQQTKKYAINFGKWLVKNEVCYHSKSDFTGEELEYYEFGGKGFGCLCTFETLIDMFNDEIYKPFVSK